MIYRPRWHRDQTLEELEMEVIMAALYHNHGNRTKASEELGIAIRTMRNKIVKYRKQGHKVLEPYSLVEREYR
jgi:DNA-binding NtrC family response regulator